ncbi:MAG: hypothetical protein QW103_00440 [Candidatus Pacearchaeota archaeon]
MENENNFLNTEKRNEEDTNSTEKKIEQPEKKFDFLKNKKLLIISSIFFAFIFLVFLIYFFSNFDLINDKGLVNNSSSGKLERGNRNISNNVTTREEVKNKSLEEIDDIDDEDIGNPAGDAEPDEAIYTLGDEDIGNPAGDAEPDEAIYTLGDEDIGNPAGEP